MAGFMDFLGDVGDTLHELTIDYGTIATILTMLEDGRGGLPTEKALPEIPAGVFGTLPAGKQMALHTHGAQAFMLSAMTEMMTTLDLYDEGVVAYRDGSTTTDEYSAEQLRKIQLAAEHGNGGNH